MPYRLLRFALSKKYPEPRMFREPARLKDSYEVVIIGEQGTDSIGVREMAASIGTIPYELLCRVGSRIERNGTDRRGHLAYRGGQSVSGGRYGFGLAGALLQRRGHLVETAQGAIERTSLCFGSLGHIIRQTRDRGGRGRHVLGLSGHQASVDSTSSAVRASVGL